MGFGHNMYFPKKYFGQIITTNKSNTKISMSEIERKFMLLYRKIRKKSRLKNLRFYNR